jgi:AraC-like DNA-binding protein
VSARLDTRHAGPGEGFDLWRDITRQAHDYSCPDDAIRRNFRASGFGCFEGSRSLLISASSPITALRRREHQDQSANALAVGLMVEGDRRAEVQSDGSSVTRASEFYFDDTHRRLESVYLQRNRTVYLNLPRDEVAALFKGDLPPPIALLGAMRASRLAPLIKAQLLAVERNGAFFSDAEGGAAISAISSLIMAALSAGREGAVAWGVTAPALLIAAKRFIERHAADPDLDVDRVAHGVGASRTALYRAFAQTDTTVAEMIRAVRLDRLRDILETRSVSVADAAERCGYGDARTMQRQFKARVGSSARDLQSRAVLG